MNQYPNQYPMSGDYRQNFQNTQSHQPQHHQSQQPQQPQQSQYGVGMMPQSGPMNNNITSYTTGNSLYQQPLNQFGLRDKVDGGTGLMQTNPMTPQFTTTIIG